MKNIEEAWDRVRELVRKGMIAEKYMKEWSKEENAKNYI